MNLPLTAATAAGAPLASASGPAANEAAFGELLVGRVRNAMLGLHTTIFVPPTAALHADLARAFTDFHACRYGSLAMRLPRVISASHARATGGGGTEHGALLAQSYLLADQTRRAAARLDGRRPRTPDRRSQRRYRACC
ncbi:hypothetical protein [Streptomyces noursei]|uniref:hypothetical protein n=1 Tax=Streptomyces noursei TaxID=1971 RepID=UPI0019996858|nr:hypothetical protein [Streptomyces noursei]MCZ1019831.1 hypothetical protein [Streptomyces noursei]GGX36351.1 hypothetical protein GCM10010341_67320 [Streptomyces noursei]